MTNFIAIVALGVRFTTSIEVQKGKNLKDERIELFGVEALTEVALSLAGRIVPSA